jgi:hypothetical protein
MGVVMGVGQELSLLESVCPERNVTLDSRKKARE